MMLGWQWLRRLEGVTGRRVEGPSSAHAPCHSSCPTRGSHLSCTSIHCGSPLGQQTSAPGTDRDVAIVTSFCLHQKSEPPSEEAKERSGS